MQVVQSNFQVDRKVGGARAKVDFFETPTRKKKVFAPKVELKKVPMIHHNGLSFEWTYHVQKCAA
jgi:hypothetical protein